jgi:hypothetical protein
MQFLKLSPAEAERFRTHAREHYLPFSEIDGVWHPIYQQECVNINVERSCFVEQEVGDGLEG